MNASKLRATLLSPRFSVGLVTLALTLSSLACAFQGPIREQLTVEDLKTWIAEKKAAGLKPGALEADLWWYQQRAFPYNQIRWDLDAAQKHRDRMPIPDPSDWGRLASNRWEYVGPHFLRGPQPQYFGASHTSGRVNGVAYSPTDSNTYYIATAGGGAWRTRDAGQTWTPLSDAWTNTRTSSIAVARGKDGKDVLFVGTGDFNRSLRLPYGFGVMRSLDGGETWTQLGLKEFGGHSIRKVLIDPDDPNIVLLTTGRSPTADGAIWRTVNALGAATSAATTPQWTAVVTAAADWSDLDVSIASPGAPRLYFAIGHASGGGELWRSDDQGVPGSWEELALPLAGQQEGLEIASSTVDRNTLFFISGRDRTIRKSTNAGADPVDVTWQDLTPGFPDDGIGRTDYNWSQAGRLTPRPRLAYDWHLTCAKIPTLGTDRIYVGLIDLVSSAQARVWRSAGRSYQVNALTHNDQHCLAVNPNDPDEFLAGNDGGVYRVRLSGDDPLAPTWSWVSLNAGLGVTQFYHAAFHPTEATGMLGGTQDNATAVAYSDLQVWGGVGAGDGGFSARFDPSQLQYTTSQSEVDAAGDRKLSIYKSQDRWGTSTNLTPNVGANNCGFIYPILEQSSNILYVGTDRLWRYNNSFDTWLVLGDGAAGQPLTGGDPEMGFVSALARAPSWLNRLYTGSGDGQVWTTSNLGEPGTWTQVNVRGTNAGTTSLPLGYVTSISVHTTNELSILVALSGTVAGTPRLWRCTNVSSATARTWTPVSGTGVEGLPDVPVNSVTRHPGSPDSHWFVGTDVGVFVTSNGGGRWQNMTAPLGLPNVQVNLVQVVPGTGYLMAATFGRGMWRISIPVPKYRIRGRVAFTVTNAPLPNTGVIAQRIGVQIPQVFVALTDANGNYALNDLPAGSYQLSASRTDHGFVETGFTNPQTVGPDRDNRNFTGFTRPSAPSNLAASVVSSSRIDLSWKDNSLIETGYEVERKTGTGAYSVIAANLAANARIFSNTGLPADTTFTYRVRCKQNSNYSPYSAERPAKTLAAPANLGSVSLDSNSVRVTWTDHSDAETGFQLQRAERGKAWVAVGEVGAGLTAWTDAGVEAGKEYAWRVRAMNEDGVSDWCPNWPWIWTLPAPGKLTAAPVSARTIRLTWADNSINERGFRLDRKTGEGAFEEIHVTSANLTDFEDRDRAPGTRYVYRLRAYRTDGVSSYSNQPEVITPTLPSAPSKLSASTAGPDRITLTWVDTANDENGFVVEKSGNGGQTFAAAGQAPADAAVFTVTGLTPNSEYAFRVRAFNANGESAWAGPISAKTARALGGNLSAPGTLNFGKVKARREKTVPLTLRNAHKSELLHVSVGKPTGAFTLVMGGDVFDLKPGQSREVLIVFRSGRKGVARGVLRLESSDPARKVHSVQLKARVK